MTRPTRPSNRRPRRRHPGGGAVVVTSDEPSIVRHAVRLLPVAAPDARSRRHRFVADCRAADARVRRACIRRVPGRMWGHACTEARVIARDTAALVARSGVLPREAGESAMTILAADTDLRRPDVSVDTTANSSPSTVTGLPQGLSVARRPTSRSPPSFRSRAGRGEARIVVARDPARPRRWAWCFRAGRDRPGVWSCSCRGRSTRGHKCGPQPSRRPRRPPRNAHRPPPMPQPARWSRRCCPTPTPARCRRPSSTSRSLHRAARRRDRVVLSVGPRHRVDRGRKIRSRTSAGSRSPRPPRSSLPGDGGVTVNVAGATGILDGHRSGADVRVHGRAIIWLACDVDRAVSDRASAQSIAFQAPAPAPTGRHRGPARVPSGPIPIDPGLAQPAAESTAARLLTPTASIGLITSIDVAGDRVTVSFEIHSAGRTVSGTGSARAQATP